METFCRVVQTERWNHNEHWQSVPILQKIMSYKVWRKVQNGLVLDVLGGTVSVERAVAVVHCTWFCDFAACFVDNLAAMFHRKWC